VIPGPREGTDMKTITLLNQKGGCGKSSCTYHLLGTFSNLGYRTLGIDLDPQSSLSQGFWGPIPVRNLDPSETVAELFPGNIPHPGQIIKPTGIPGVDVIPGSRHATNFNTPRPWEAPLETQTCLRSFLEEIRDSYDLVLCDCPPNLHLCSWVAMTASDHIIIPVQPEDFGAMGIVDVQESIAMVQATTNAGLQLVGYLLTMVGRKALHQVFEDQLRSIYGDAVFAAVFPEAVAFAESITKRLPIEQYKPKGAPAKAMRALADEVLARIERMNQADRMEAA
jgi:chromosome partitioning protein